MSITKAFTVTYSNVFQYRPSINNQDATVISH